MSVAAAGARAEPNKTRERRRPRLFFALAVLMLLIVIAAFTPTMYLRQLFDVTDFATGGRELPLHLLAHGLFLTAWFMLLVAQTGLIAAGRTAAHVRLGVAGIAVAVGLVATSWLTLARVVTRVQSVLLGQGYDAAAIEQGLRERVLFLVTGGFFATLVFVVLVAAALMLRRNAATHKRLMLIASLNILVVAALSPGRPVGRVLEPVLGVGGTSAVVTLAFLGALVWHDLRTRQRIEKSTIWGTVATVVGISLTPVVGFTWGMDVVHWLGRVAL